MKFLIVFVALFAVVLAGQEGVQIVKSEQDVGTDAYSYAYETSDGSSAQQQGKIQHPGDENEAISVTGSFTYVGDDGVTYSVNYLADENGFQPQGAHLPVAPAA